jgi:putative DNA primase/helicase
MDGSFDEWVESGCPPNAKDVDLSEDGVASYLTAVYGDKLRFDHDQDRWFEWTGDRWKPDNTCLAYSYCREVSRKVSDKLLPRDKASMRKASFAAGVERLARSDRTHAVNQSEWDQDPWLLGCPGGAVDLRTGQLEAADPSQGITKHVVAAPSGTGCPTWLRFLSEATLGDHEMVEFLQRWCGYCLTGDTREHALIFLYGPGGNGKSVFLNTIDRIMGDYATTAAMDTFTSSRGDKHPTELALLKGARLVSSSETEEGRAWAESRIKQMTGGDPISARFMRQDFFTYIPQFKLTIVGNHAPALANVDEAARRRFNIVPFIVKPENPDRELEAKLEKEWPAILQWMIDGCLMWHVDGLKRPDSVKAATAEYFAGQDLTAQWLEECTRLEPRNEHLFETSADLFKSWADFAKGNGEETGSAKGMAARLRRHGLRPQAKKIEGKTYRGWQGAELHRRNDGGLYND